MKRYITILLFFLLSFALLKSQELLSARVLIPFDNCYSYNALYSADLSDNSSLFLGQTNDFQSDKSIWHLTEFDALQNSTRDIILSRLNLDSYPIFLNPELKKLGAGRYSIKGLATNGLLYLYYHYCIIDSLGKVVYDTVSRVLDKGHYGIAYGYMPKSDNSMFVFGYSSDSDHKKNEFLKRVDNYNNTLGIKYFPVFTDTSYKIGGAAMIPARDSNSIYVSVTYDSLYDSTGHRGLSKYFINKYDLDLNLLKRIEFPRYPELITMPDNTNMIKYRKDYTVYEINWYDADLNFIKTFTIDFRSIIPTCNSVLLDEIVADGKSNYVVSARIVNETNGYRKLCVGFFDKNFNLRSCGIYNDTLQTNCMFSKFMKFDTDTLKLYAEYSDMGTNAKYLSTIVRIKDTLAFTSVETEDKASSCDLSVRGRIILLPETSDQNASINVFDELGSKVLSAGIDCNKSEIELPDIAPGVYLYEYLRGNKTCKGKFLILK